MTGIGSYAFHGCTGLTSIEIPNSVTGIGSYAFRGCTGLTSIEIPNSVTWIGKSAFWGCINIISLNVDTDNINYCSEDNVLFNKDKTHLIYCPAGKKIPNSVKWIGDYAFSGCTGLTSIEIPNSVTGIGHDAFSGCTGLASIKIPNSVTEIGDWSFYGCTGLTSIEIPNSVTGIGSYAFEGCTNLTEIHIHNENPDIIKASFNENDVEHITLYVPVGTGYAYRHHPEFKKFKEVKIERRKN